MYSVPESIALLLRFAAAVILYWYVIKLLRVLIKYIESKID